jgi:hypothetical protein
MTTIVQSGSTITSVTLSGLSGTVYGILIRNEDGDQDSAILLFATETDRTAYDIESSSFNPTATGLLASFTSTNSVLGGGTYTLVERNSSGVSGTVTVTGFTQGYTFELVTVPEVSRILMNSGGGLHIDGSRIVILPPGRSTESCACCGPPQPPPPECTRCNYGLDEEGLPVWGAGIKKDFAIEISGILDQQRHYVKAWYEHQIYNPPNPETGAQPCGCEFLRIDFEYELVLNGFAALNGTYYGRDAHTSDPPGDDIVFNTASSVDGCNPSGNAFDPADLTSISGCLEEDPCDYNCGKDVWMKDVLITGTFNCTRTVVSSCNGVVSTVNNVTSASLEGYAYIAPDSTVFTYDPIQPPSLTILGGAQGAAIRPYDTDGIVKFGWLNRLLAESFTGVSSNCVLTAPTINDIWKFGCPNPFGLTLTDYSCHPLWRIVRKAFPHTCNTGTVTHPTTIIDLPGCTNTDEYESISPVVYPNCAPIYTKGYVTETRPAFYSQVRHIWTNA